ncbi:hypothetical protein Q674_08495 [Acinetobacter sp. COS3]|uniref:serine/threonine-protein kinase n=1 Tax=Acinetobacter sp. COS3 TaxID=1397525 RepID=UPI0003B80D77|nr:serine/threonine-protein kinase [Acinetobacter sp. COS3]ERS03629.1 hypothetical protein Q674_08495 [Acinetobacter sp. COS3]
MLGMLDVGDKLYKYELVDRIGGGNFGQVWVAKDHTLDKNVAVKILDDTNEPVFKHLQEAKYGHCVTHQNVVHVHYADVIEHNGLNLVVIAMDLHPGSVEDELNSAHYVEIKRATKIIIDVLKGLEYLHEKDIFHNDIKPSNIIISNTKSALLTDYGISIQTKNLQPIQSPNSYRLHAAPETLITQNISVQTDIYQLGLTFYRIINGIGNIKDIRAKLGEDEFNQSKITGDLLTHSEFLPFVPSNLKKIVLKASHVDPKQRYQTALEMRKDLEKISLFGFWTINSTGEEVGHLNNNIYTYQQIKKNGYFEFVPLKTSANGRTTKMQSRIVKCRDLNKLEKTKSKFMQDVVLGNI